MKSNCIISANDSGEVNASPDFIPIRRERNGRNGKPPGML